MSIRQLKITKSITNRENESLEKYLHEISKVQLISSDEETNLAKLIKKGEQSALDKLIKSNLDNKFAKQRFSIYSFERTINY